MLILSIVFTKRHLLKSSSCVVTLVLFLKIEGYFVAARHVITNSEIGSGVSIRAVNVWLLTKVYLVLPDLTLK